MAVTYASVLLQHRPEALTLPQTYDAGFRASIPQAVIVSRISAATARRRVLVLFFL